MLRAFSAGDAFVGFHEDTIPSVVIQVYKELEREEHEDFSQDGTEDPWESEVKTKLSLTIKEYHRTRVRNEFSFEKVNLSQYKRLITDSNVEDDRRAPEMSCRRITLFESFFFFCLRNTNLK